MNTESQAFLEGLREEWEVNVPGQWENDTGPKDWFAVSNNDGIVAYFGTEDDANEFRNYKIIRAFSKYEFDKQMNSGDYDR